MADIEKWQKEEAVRKAEVAFITDDLRRPVEFWWEKISKDFLPLSDFRHRAKQGKWQARRDKYWNGVTQGVLRDSKRRAILDRSRELQEIQQIRQNTLELIMPRVVNGQKIYRIQPSSYEGMIRSLVQLDQLAEAKRDNMLKMIEPDITQEINRPASVFTSEEIRGVARMLLESRRARQQEFHLGLPAAEGKSEDTNGEKKFGGQ